MWFSTLAAASVPRLLAHSPSSAVLVTVWVGEARGQLCPVPLGAMEWVPGLSSDIRWQVQKEEVREL